MDSAAKMKALSLQLVILLAVARNSICQVQAPTAVPDGVKAISADNATEFSCLNRTFDMYFPNIETGCQKFHLCTKTDGDEVLNLSFMCPAGTSFDFRSADCQSAETVTCKPENGGTRAVRKVSKQLKNKLQLTQPKTSFKCRGKKLGTYYADVDTNCTTFHLCTMGEFKSEILDFQFMCLEGTLFDEQWLQCRPEASTSCGKIKPKATLLDQQPIAIPVPAQTELTNPLIPPQPLQESTTSELPVPQDPTAKLEPAPLQPIAHPEEPLQQTKLPEPEPTTTTVGPDYLTDFNGTEADYDYYEDTLPVREKRSAVPVTIQKIMSVSSERIRVKRVPPPNLTSDNLPVTSFSCADKIPGGYYADVEAGCQMYHVCAPGADGTMRSTKFLCGNNTIFSQQTRTCQIWYTVDCESTPQFFTLNEELSRVLPEDNFGGSTSSGSAASQPTQQQAFEQSSSLSRRPTQQQAFEQSSSLSRRPTESGDSQQFQRPRQSVQAPASSLTDGFDVFIDRQPFQTNEPEFAQQIQSAVRDDQRPEFVSRFQQLAEVQRAEDAARDNVANRPARRRKQKRRRKQRPRPQPQPEVRDPFQQELFNFGISDSQSHFQGVGAQRPTTVPPPQRVPTFSSDSHFAQPQQITEPQVFNIQDHVPGLLEEIQVRGRFQQSEDDLIREAAQQSQPRRNPATRLQQQESIEVRVPTAQRIAPRPSDAASGPAEATSSQIGQPASSFPDQSTQAGGAIFAGFDAFIQDAIQQEHEQRAKFGPILEQRRQQQQREEEAERERQREADHQREEQRQTTRKRKRPKTTTARPAEFTRPQESQLDFVPPQEFQPSFVAAPQRQPQQPVLRFPDFPTRVAQPSQPPIRSEPQPVSVQNQGRIALVQTVQPRPAVSPPPQRQQAFQAVPVPQPASNFDGFIFQQFAQRPQQVVNHAATGIRDGIVFLVPSESELLPTVFVQPGQAASPSAHNQAASPPAHTQAPEGQQFAGPSQHDFQQPSLSQTHVPTHGQSQLLVFNSANSSGFEIRTRVRRQASSVALTEKTPKDEVYPNTPFSCKDKVLGGYYADTYTNCNMFHICTSGRKKGLLYDFRFWCANGTVFNQRSQTCSAPDKVNCDLSTKYYPTHPPPKEMDVPVPNAELLKIRVKRAVKNVLAMGPNTSPDTSFRCAGREANRYYADAETNCQIFHLCAENSPGGRLVDYPFFCRNGTVFDQRSQACDDQTDLLNCQDDPPHYGIGEDFGRF